MLKSLRIKIIGSTMLVITCLVFAITATINICNAYSLLSKADSMINLITQFNGNMPDNMDDFEGKVNFNINDETPFRTRYFVLFLDKDGNIVNSITSNISTTAHNHIDQYANFVKKCKNGQRGNALSFRFLATKTDNGMMVTFLDRSQDHETILALLTVSTFISVIGIFCTLAFLILISQKILAPFIRNQEKQKQFITDAGHELKTPLAIIRTNAEVLEMCGGSNEWIDSIKNQTTRLDGLVKGLLTLAKSGELNNDNEHLKFSLSAAVNEIAMPFKTLADSKGHKMHFDIASGIEYTGDAQSISTLVSILIDNAIKYASKNGEIFVTLSPMGRGTLKTAKLVIENDTALADDEDPNRFFERFYRSEGSRSRQTGGYGIGLSVAQTIIEQHKGKITVSHNGNRIAFTVIL